MKLDLKGLTTDCTCVDKACDTKGNSCGVHFHTGTTCTTASTIGGHYYPTTITTDPWNGANGAFYNNKGATATHTSTLKVSYGYTLKESMSHAFVVHDNTGSRIGCGVLEVYLTLAAGFWKYSIFLSFALLAFLFKF